MIQTIDFESDEVKKLPLQIKSLLRGLLDFHAKVKMSPEDFERCKKSLMNSKIKNGKVVSPK